MRAETLLANLEVLNSVKLARDSGSHLISLKSKMTGRPVPSTARVHIRLGEHQRFISNADLGQVWLSPQHRDGLRRMYNISKGARK